MGLSYGYPMLQSGSECSNESSDEEEGIDPESCEGERANEFEEESSYESVGEKDC